MSSNNSSPPEEIIGRRSVSYREVFLEEKQARHEEELKIHAKAHAKGPHIAESIKATDHHHHSHRRPHSPPESTGAQTVENSVMKTKVAPGGPKSSLRSKDGRPKKSVLILEPEKGMGESSTDPVDDDDKDESIPKPRKTLADIVAEEKASCRLSHEPTLSLKQLNEHFDEHKHLHGDQSWYVKGSEAIISIAAVIGVLIVIFGVIPLGPPNTDSLEDKLIFICVTNPLVFSFLTLLICMLFYSVLSEKTPWHHWTRYVPAFLVSYTIQVGVMFAIYPFTETFPFMGLIPLFTCCVISVSFIRGAMHLTWPVCDCGYYRVVMKSFSACVISVFLYILLMSFWLLAYHESDSVGQAILPFVLLVPVFGWKKYLLAKTDQFPIVIAMLMAGFWVENLDDIFQTMVFPSVDSPGTAYVALFARKLGENVSYLIFLTEWWFRFRVWIKDFFKHLCHKDMPHAKPIVEDVSQTDRGHSNIRPAYWRRQTQFLMYKIMSQSLSYVFYLVVTPQLRSEKDNGIYYPFHDGSSEESLTDENYYNSLIFAGVSLVSTLLTGVVSAWLIRRYRRKTYDEISGTYGRLFRHPKYYGFMCLILLSNALVAFNTLLYHNRLWFFQENEVPDIDVTE
eukprot:m.69971 g.69971  ORF g.69971 m.69971 type:complete len:623 (+) comp12096_c0_seq1:201-2069(+)